MRAPRFALALLGLALAGCYTTSSMGAEDARVSDDTHLALDARLADAAITPLLGCSDAPQLANDGLERLDLAAAVTAPVDSCVGSGRYVFRRVEVPPRTGITFRTEGTNAPVTSLFDRCSTEGDRCRSFGPSGFFSPGEPTRETYYGNPDDTARTLFVALWWVGEEQPPFTLTTRSAPVAAEGRCAAPRALAVGELIPASRERGGTYESWDCWFLPESHFASTTLPGRHLAVPLEGSQLLRSIEGCACSDRTSADALVNFTDAPRPLLLEVSPTEPIGVRFEPIPPSAICEEGVLLPVDGVARDLDRFPRLLSGLGECAYNDPHHYLVEIPAGRAVEIVATLGTPYPVIQVLGACGAPDSCRAPEVIARDDRGYTVRVGNTSAEARVEHVVLGSEGPAEGPLTGTVRARLVEE